MTSRLILFAAFVVFMALPAPAMAMSFVHDCSNALEELDEGVKGDNACSKDSDCTMIAQPPCGCESLAVNRDNADAGSEAMRICTGEGLVCEPCMLDPDAPSPRARCKKGNCKLID